SIGNREVTRLLLARNAQPGALPSGRPSPPVPSAVPIARSPVWIYPVAAVAGAALGTTTGILVGLSSEMVIESGAAAATLGAGLTYLIQRVRSRNVPAS